MSTVGQESDYHYNTNSGLITVMGLQTGVNKDNISKQFPELELHFNNYFMNHCVIKGSQWMIGTCMLMIEMV